VVQLEAQLTFDDVKRHKELDAWRDRFQAKVDEAEAMQVRVAAVSKVNERSEMLLRRYQEQVRLRRDRFSRVCELALVEHQRKCVKATTETAAAP
jgi:hypothetical protein